MDQISTKLTKTEGKVFLSEIRKLIHSVGISNKCHIIGRSQLEHLFIKSMIKVTNNYERILFL
jgi:hypothetical protein